MSGNTAQTVVGGKTFLGIELGSTRIKAVLIDDRYTPIASGGFDWENRLENGLWTYHLDDVWTGVQTSFKRLREDVQSKYGVQLTTVGGIGISAMMHGYLALDKNGNQLAEFRTWRNTNTGKAAEKLTELFQFNVPLRWSVAHLYQVILDNEKHVGEVSFITTLAGYVHWKLTGQNVIGVGDASGMFPIENNNYNAKMLAKFNTLAGYKLEDILPKVFNAGDNAGALTDEGAKLLDPTGQLKAGIPICPPEGDAGTGMVATNSVAVRTGNVSAGTSIFAMIVLEKELSKLYTEIDMVTTPAGKPVAMVHCNNCTSDLDAWVKLFSEVNELTGHPLKKPELYDALYFKALEGDTDCGGLLSYNYYSGEPITGFDEGRPLFTRLPDSRFTLANFARTLLFSTMGTLKLGMDILTDKEHVKLEQLLGHGGLFKTKGVGQRLMAAALNVPVSVMESAGEGGAWGIALLAAYMVQKGADEKLEDFLTQKVFASHKSERVEPNSDDAKGFNTYMKRYTAGLTIERAAVENLK